MNAATITIRPAYADDQLALLRLAALDSAPEAPPRPILLAEVDGELRVALSLRDGTAIADPFFPTAAIVRMLREHLFASKRQWRFSSLERLNRGAAPGTRTDRRTPAWSR